MYILYHDNGVSGQYGMTEYSSCEVADKGGIYELLNSYTSSNITVYSWDVVME